MLLIMNEYGIDYKFCEKNKYYLGDKNVNCEWYLIFIMLRGI